MNNLLLSALILSITSFASGCLFLIAALIGIAYLLVPGSNKLWGKQGKEETGKGAIGAVILGSVLLIFSWTCNTPDKPENKAVENSNSQNAFESLPMEQKLASLDAANGAFASKDDIKVVRIRALLGFISNSFKEPQDTIGEWTSKAQDVLEKKYGIKETCLHILEEMNAMGKVDNTPYRDAITLYLMVRARQTSETK